MMMYRAVLEPQPAASLGVSVFRRAQMPVLSHIGVSRPAPRQPALPPRQPALPPRVIKRPASHTAVSAHCGLALGRIAPGQIPGEVARAAPTGQATGLAGSPHHAEQPAKHNAAQCGQLLALPSALQSKLDSWGLSLRQRVASSRTQWLQQHAGGLGVSASWPPSREKLVVGTDCSGAEAPIWSLRSMGIQHRHVFSCDVSVAVRKFISQCSPPEGPVYHDMLKRDPAGVPAHSVYVCGFPCTPFSLLRRHSTKLLRELAAKPFFAAVRMIKESLPPLAILENVSGIRQVMKYVVGHFVALAWYYVLVIPIDSADLGEPVKRPRYYFVLLRRDVAVIQDRQKLTDFVKAMLTAARAPRVDSIVDRMLPTSHPSVQGYLAQRRGASGVSASRRGGGEPRWITHSANYMRSHRLSGPAPGAGASSDMKGLTTSRAHAAWTLLTRAHPSLNLVADVSQNVHRASVCVDGCTPTITPRSLIAIKKAGRIMAPVEKILVHNFPLHKMRMPKDMTEKEAEDLGGNTMHLASVGLALLIGMAGVDWSASAAQVGRKPAGAAPSKEPAIYLGSLASGGQKSGRKRQMPLPAGRNKARRRSS